MELTSLWANNVRLALAPFKVPFREVHGSCREEVADAIERMRARGVQEVTVRDITNEVHEVAPEWSLETIGAAIRRDARGAGDWASPLPLGRCGFARYKIL